MRENLIKKDKVEIQDYVCIGANVVILTSVIAGPGCIIGAGSVVSKNLDEFSIYAGVQAKKIMNI